MASTKPESPKPKVRKPAYIAARLHTEIADLRARVARASQALTDANAALTAKVKELDGQDAEVKEIAQRMLGMGGEAAE